MDNPIGYGIAFDKRRRKRMQKFTDAIFRFFLCRFGFHGFSPHELSWPVDRTEVQFHCSHCQRVVEVVSLT